MRHFLEPSFLRTSPSVGRSLNRRDRDDVLRRWLAQIEIPQNPPMEGFSDLVEVFEPKSVYIYSGRGVLVRLPDTLQRQIQRAFNIVHTCLHSAQPVMFSSASLAFKASLMNTIRRKVATARPENVMLCSLFIAMYLVQIAYLYHLSCNN